MKPTALVIIQGQQPHIENHRYTNFTNKKGYRYFHFYNKRKYIQTDIQKHTKQFHVYYITIDI